MSQHIQHHHPQQPQYIHYAGPPNPQPYQYIQNVAAIPGQPQHMTHVLQYQPQQPGQPQPQGAGQGQAGQPNVTTHVQAAAHAQGVSATPGTTATPGPLVAQGDWTKDLVQLAKQAELKKHALALQLHTAHILSAHASLELKSKSIQDIKEQKNKLESERARLLKCLQEINADRDQADLAESTLTQECEDLRGKITILSEGEYALAKTDVDRLRSELGQPPLPSLQQTLEERTAAYLNDRRMQGQAQAQGTEGVLGSDGEGEEASHRRSVSKRGAPSEEAEGSSAKRPRGRPKGSKNRKVAST